MNQEHIVKSFDQELAQIEKTILEMGGLAEKQLADAIQAVIKKDAEMGIEVVESDRRIDQMEGDIDAMVIRIIALRQPKAMDLRAVIAVLKVAGNLERIGDYAKNIGKRVNVLAEARLDPAGYATVDRMARLVLTMLRDVLDAYIERDVERAEEIRVRDNDVDQIYNTLFRELLTFMIENPRNISACMHMLFIAKNLERIGDHVTSIAEQTQYLVSGVLPDVTRPTSDKTSYISVMPE